MPSGEGECRAKASARLLVLRQAPLVVRGRGLIAVVSAGTADVPVRFSSNVLLTFLDKIDIAQDKLGDSTGKLVDA